MSSAGPAAAAAAASVADAHGAVVPMRRVRAWMAVRGRGCGRGCAVDVVYAGLALLRAPKPREEEEEHWRNESAGAAIRAERRCGAATAAERARPAVRGAARARRDIVGEDDCVAGLWCWCCRYSQELNLGVWNQEWNVAPHSAAPHYHELLRTGSLGTMDTLGRFRPGADGAASQLP